jgi:hypothetical protein
MRESGTGASQIPTLIPPLSPLFLLIILCPLFFRPLVVAGACTNTSVLGVGGAVETSDLCVESDIPGDISQININSIYDLCGAWVLGP